MTFYMWIAMLAWCLLTVGVIKRNEKMLHAWLMRAGIFIDIALVLYLQFTREAIQTAVSLELSLLPNIHILFSTLALLLYFPVLFLGWKLLNGKMEVRDTHIKIGYSAYVFRTLGLFFMFSMWQY